MQEVPGPIPSMGKFILQSFPQYIIIFPYQHYKQRHLFHGTVSYRLLGILVFTILIVAITFHQYRINDILKVFQELFLLQHSQPLVRVGLEELQIDILNQNRQPFLPLNWIFGNPIHYTLKHTVMVT